MHTRKLSIGSAIAAWLVPAIASAIGLGEISVDSNLNQPLKAEIQLVSTSPAEVADLEIRMAPDQIFQQIGIERVGLLNYLNFEPSVRNGVPVIEVTSSRPITEPFLNFVIEVAWPRGKLLREYTVLLDPPTYRAQQAPLVSSPVTTAPVVNAQPAAPVDELANIPLAETFPVSEPIPSAASAEPVTSVEAEIPMAVTVPAEESGIATSYTSYMAGDSYEVQKGDTLWQIADRYKAESSSTEQMMIALLHDNPRAFMGGNINRLKSGYILRMPELEAVESTTPSQARRQVREQIALWEKYRSRLADTAAPQQPVDRSETAAAEPTEVKPADTQTPETGSAGTETAAKSELEIIVPDKTAESAIEGTVLADAGITANLEKEVSLAKEQIESQSKENEELKSRITELETILGDKDRLLQLKDEQLLEMQQKFAAPEETKLPEVATSPEEVKEEVKSTAEEAVKEEAQVPEQAPAVQPEPQTTQESSVATPEVAEAETVAEPAAEITPDNLLPRIPLDEEGNAISQVQLPEPPVAVEKPVQVAQADPVSSSRPTPAELSTEEQGNGFFSDLMRNPLMVGAAGLGGLLLLSLGWLMARRKRHEDDFEITPMARAPLVGAASGAAFDKSIFPPEQVSERNADVSERAPETPLDDLDLDTDFSEDIPSAPVAQTAQDVVEAAFGKYEPEMDEEWPGLAPEQEVAETVGKSDLDITFDDLELPQESAEIPEKVVEVAQENDEILAEADVYLAYGLNEQAIDLLKPAVADHPNRVDYHAKLLEAFYALEDKDSFLEEASTMHDLLDGGRERSPVWDRALAMGKDIAPEHEMFSAAQAPSVSLDELNAEKEQLLDIDLGDSDFLSSELDDDELRETVIRDDSKPIQSISDVSSTAFQDTQAIDSADLAFALEGLELPEGEVDTDTEISDIMLDDATLHGLTLVDKYSKSDGDLTGEFRFGSDDMDQIKDVPDATSDGLSFDSDFGADPTFHELERPDQAETEIVEAPFVDDTLSASMEMTQAFVPDFDHAPDTTQTDTTGLDLTSETLSFNMLDEGGDEAEISLITGEDEMGTKLDLAKAYIDMGDREGAREALEEVLSGGTDQQRSEAEKLLNQLG